jgi:dienelactone hydrolase
MADLDGRRLSVARNGLYGVYYAPRARERRPAVITIGGARGGLRTRPIARAFAARGYPALALAYFKAPGLGNALEGIPLEYFVRAARWVARQPGVDSSRIILMGGSRGGEAALLAAGEFPRVFHGAIGLVPSAYLTSGDSGTKAAWTVRGEALPIGMDVPIAKIRGPVLIAGAGRDEVWGSARAVEDLSRMLRDAHFAYPHDEVVYPRAGHSIGSAIPARLWSRVWKLVRELERN